MRVTFFHTAYGTPSAPGAKEAELLERASLISSLVRGVVEGVPCQAPPAQQGVLGGEEVIKQCVVD